MHICCGGNTGRLESGLCFSSQTIDFNLVFPIPLFLNTDFFFFFSQLQSVFSFIKDIQTLQYKKILILYLPIYFIHLRLILWSFLFYRGNFLGLDNQRSLSSLWQFPSDSDNWKLKYYLILFFNTFAESTDESTTEKFLLGLFNI